LKTEGDETGVILRSIINYVPFAQGSSVLLKEETSQTLSILMVDVTGIEPLTPCLQRK
jgi:hypothetical protein